MRRAVGLITLAAVACVLPSIGGPAATSPIRSGNLAADRPQDTPHAAEAHNPVTPPGDGARGFQIAEPRTGFALKRGALPRAKSVLAEIQRRKGQPPPGHIGGRPFENRERRLPRGVYREYDVNAKVPGRSRDAERIVIEQKTGKAYYSGDHYDTFIPLN